MDCLEETQGQAVKSAPWALQDAPRGSRGHWPPAPSDGPECPNAAHCDAHTLQTPAQQRVTILWRTERFLLGCKFISPELLSMLVNNADLPLWMDRLMP